MTLKCFLNQSFGFKVHLLNKWFDHLIVVDFEVPDSLFIKPMDVFVIKWILSKSDVYPYEVNSKVNFCYH